MLNKAAVREHALACSKQFRNGKFTRIGEDFLHELGYDIEALIRELQNKHPTLHAPLLNADPDRFLTPDLRAKLEEAVGHLVARMIQNKIQRQPSVGCTLGATR